MEEKTWQELGMKPGIRVPGTGSWMRKWRANPNQHKMIDYAREVDRLVKTMSESKVNQAIHLSGKWHPSDEVIIAAAIRRRPVWEGKFNLMEESLMSKRNEKKGSVKKETEKAEGTSLKARIEALEKEVDALNEAVRQLVQMPETEKGPDFPDFKKKKKEKGKKAETATGDTAALLKALEKAKKDGDKKEAFKIRGKLRKAGYSLRTNGKK
jgi:hypothetical protein